MDRRTVLAGMGLLGAGAAAPAVAAQASVGFSVADGLPVVIGQSYVMRSAILGEARAINVYLPPSYAKISQQTYPVVFLLDGGQQPEDFHHITGLLQVGAANGYLREMILIGIADTDRRRDFTYPSQDPQDMKDYPTTGGSAAFRRFIAEELQPWVKGTFRTSGEKAVIGESLAGLFIVETLLKQADLFDTYIAVSPSLWWDGGRLAKSAPERLAAMPAGKRRLWLSLASEGAAMGLDPLVAALKAAPPPGLTWSFTPMPGDSHATTFQPSAYLAFRALYAAPPPKA